MSEPENRQNEQLSDSDPWIKNERGAESEPGRKERMPSSVFQYSAQQDFMAILTGSAECICVNSLVFQFASSSTLIYAKNTEKPELVVLIKEN